MDSHRLCRTPHWTYLLDWLGMKHVGNIELRPGIPPTPKHKKEIEDLMKARGIKLVIVSSWKEPMQSREVAYASGAALAILPGEIQALPGTDDYITCIEYMVTELARAIPSSDKELEK